MTTTTNISTPEAPIEEFDSIVIGSGLGGLTVASLLSQLQEDCRVLVLEQNPYHAGGCCQAFERQGYRFGVGVHFVGDVAGKGRSEKRMMDALSDTPVEWTPMEQGLGDMMIGTDKLKTFKTDSGHWKQSLLELFPDEEGAIEKLSVMSKEACACFRQAMAFKAMPRWLTSVLIHTGLDRVLNKNYRKYAKMTVAEALKAITTNLDLQTYLGLSCACYGMTPEEAPFLMHSVFFAEDFPGMFYPTGGPGMIPESISRTITKCGGEVRLNARVRQILIKGGRAMGVELDDGTEIRAKKQVISDAGFVKTFRQFVPVDQLPSRRMRKAVKVPLNNGMTGMVVYVGLEGTYDEDFKLNHGLSVENPNMTLPDTFEGLSAVKAEELSVYITCPSAKDSAWKEKYPGRTTLEILLMYVPWKPFSGIIDENGDIKEEEKEAYEQFKHDFGQKIWSRSRQALLVNGASGTLPELLDDADVAEVGTPITFHRFLGSDLGAWYGLEHSIERFRPRNFYLTLRPECDIDGLYLTGEDVSTDGVVGAMIGGYLCASKIMGVRNFLDLPKKISQIKPTKA
jgi:all-trans-retinol 13,14-reductase